MACDLLKKGWTRDELNARLGHTPSSRIIDRYINFLALDRNKPKKKIYDGKMSELNAKVEEFEGKEKLNQARIKRLIEENEAFKKEYESRLEDLRGIMLKMKGEKAR